MGVDEALMASAVRTGRPALRFYSWQGPWLSLGYGQAILREQIGACSRAGVGMVRRVTGGRAVLHGNDLTYALAARDGQLPDGLMASYGLVAEALIRGFETLGVEANATPATPRREAFPHRFGPVSSGTNRPQRVRAGFDCFARAAGREICVDGKKLAGSAQRRAKGGILQHGSIRLRPDPLEVRRATALDGLAATSLVELGAESGTVRVREALVQAFESVLGTLKPDELTSDERADAEDRVRHHRRETTCAPSGYADRVSRQPLADR
jgi:lipoate-protein ligase A